MIPKTYRFQNNVARHRNARSAPLWIHRDRANSFTSSAPHGTVRTAFASPKTEASTPSPQFAAYHSACVSVEKLIKIKTLRQSFQHRFYGRRMQGRRKHAIDVDMHSVLADSISVLLPVGIRRTTFRAQQRVLCQPHSEVDSLSSTS